MAEKNIIKATNYAIDKPQQVIKMATIVKKHIVDNNLSVKIANNNYVMVEGWQFAGGLMGLFPRIVKVENIAPGKWLAQAEIIEKKTGNVVSVGYAVCSLDEQKKKSFDDYALLSMAQTRAIGKAFRNLIGWVIKMSGYESTPAEEMPSDIKKPATPAQKNPKPTIEMTLAGIKTSKDKAALVKAKVSILESTNYTQQQKSLLVEAIDVRIEAIK